MTTLSLYQSAVFPGQTSDQPWDFNWTRPFELTELSHAEFSRASGDGEPKLISYDSTIGYDGTVDVPAIFKPGQYSEDDVYVWSDQEELRVSIHPSVLRDGAGQPYTEQSVGLRSIWNNIKDVRISHISTQVLNISNFVDTWIDASADDDAHVVNIDVAKRGSVSLGDGNDSIRIGVAANEYSWSSHFKIAVGNGNDTVDVKPETYAVLGDLQAPYGWEFNATPQLTTADITVGDGNDTVSLAEVSGTIHVGDGNDRINITDGTSTVWLGGGRDLVTIAAPKVSDAPMWAYDTQVGSSTVHAGSGHADISIDDSTPSRTPRTVLAFMRGETGGDTLAAADVVRYGHYDIWTSTFSGGDLSAVAIDLAGYSPGSTTTLAAPTAPGSPMLLQIHDAATGSVDALALYGETVASVASLDVRFT